MKQTGEVRVTDALTGGEKGSKPERYDLIPPGAMDEVARVYGYGASKYASRNWEKGYDWGLSLAALHRHVKAFERGEDIDRESGCHHLAHAAFHCLALVTYQAFGLGTDTRTRLGRGVTPTPREIVAPGASSPAVAPAWGRPMEHGPALTAAANRLLPEEQDALAQYRKLEVRLRRSATQAEIEQSRVLAAKARQWSLDRTTYIDAAGKAVSVLGDPGARRYGEREFTEDNTRYFE